MIIDSQLQLSDAQALAASGPSTNVINLRDARDIGAGEPLAIVVTVDEALAGTTPTFQVQVQTDDAEAFPSPRTPVSSEQVSALAAGEQIVIPLPPGVDEQFLRLNYLLGGTGPSITVTAFLVPLSMVDKFRTYPSGFTVS